MIIIFKSYSKACKYKQLFFLGLVTLNVLFLNSLNAQIKVGAEKTSSYLPQLIGKNVAVLGNQSSLIQQTHLVDSLLSLGIHIKKVFCPEHGFRGNADAGEHVKNYTDKKTGLPVISLYGKHKKPLPDDLKGIDIVVFDLQDVGVRFYTYISSMHYMMEACAESKVKFLVLDRPNPNGFYVDGPVLEDNCKSFVGMHKVPVVHGMTVAEYAQMINNEGWLANAVKCDLSYVTVDNYTHSYLYSLPIKPSPNLPNMASVYLYPSLCFFEGTIISMGRGTDKPFQVYGHPALKNANFEFMPRSITGASKNPPFKGEKCHGFDLTSYGENLVAKTPKLYLEWLIFAYQNMPDKNNFFNNFFEKLAGTTLLKQQIIEGKNDMDIRKTWQKDLEAFKNTRKKYLLYTDFE